MIVAFGLGLMMLLLLAVYGLRSGEVRALKLEHLDWEKNLIWVPRAKGRRTQCYPLAETVGEAILRYLEEGRPKSSGCCRSWVSVRCWSSAATRFIFRNYIPRACAAPVWVSAIT